MKRILGLAIAFLALGFAASVATAWAIAIWFPFETKAVPEGASLHEIDLGALATSQGVPYLPPGVFDRVWRSGDFLRHAGWRGAAATWPSGGGRWLIEFEAYGFPLPCMALVPHELFLRGSGPILGFYDIPRTTYAVPSFLSVHPAPCVPIWSTLCCDAVVNGALLFLLLLGPLRLRAWLRHRRGQCVRCGYQLTDPATCPECGRAAASRAPSGHDRHGGDRATA